MTKQELLIIAKASNTDLILGALGELEGCNAYVEQTQKHPIWQTKYFGVSYWYKGITDGEIIDRATITKRAFVEIARLMFPFGLLSFKKLIPGLLGIYRAEGGLKARCLKIYEFCPACQELISAGLKIAKDEKIKDLIYCFAMFLQFSPTYRFYLQDILGELDKENLMKQPALELIRLKNLFLLREKSGDPKMNTFARMFLLMIIFKKKQIRDFLMELDIEKTKLDESDWYYCFRRPSYDFGGKSLWDRVKEAAIIDDEKGHLILGI